MSDPQPLGERGEDIASAASSIVLLGVTVLALGLYSLEEIFSRVRQRKRIWGHCLGSLFLLLCGYNLTMLGFRMVDVSMEAIVSPLAIRLLPLLAAICLLLCHSSLTQQGCEGAEQEHLALTRLTGYTAGLSLTVLIQVCILWVWDRYDLSSHFVG